MVLNRARRVPPCARRKACACRTGLARYVLPRSRRSGCSTDRYQSIEALYDTLLHPAEGRGLAPKTVYEIHLIIRGSLDDAVRRRLVTRNVALVARAPKQRSLQRIEGQAWTEEELHRFLRTAAGHRHFPIMWLTAMTGMRRPRQHRPHPPDLPSRPRRHAGRHSADLRASRQARSTGVSEGGGTSEEHRVTR